MIYVRQRTLGRHVQSLSAICVMMVVAAAFPCQAQGQQASPPYAVFELPTLGGNHSAGWKVSSTGDVIGGAFLPGNVFHPTVWIDGQAPVDLGTLGGNHGECRGVNNNGWIVGWAHTPGQGLFDGSAFLWRDGVMENLGYLGTGDFAEAYGINDHNQIVGWAEIDDLNSPRRAFLWQNGEMSELGNLEGSIGGQGIAINNAGLIVGQAWSAQHTTWRPAIWRDGQIIDLGNFGGGIFGLGGVCIDLNEAGDVVGYTGWDPFSVRAFLYRDGRKYPLPEKLHWTNSFAWSINDNRQVVGAARTERTGIWQDIGVIWEWERPVEYLIALIPPKSDWFIGTAIGINNAGQITGTGYRLSDPDYTKGYLITPVQPTMVLHPPSPGLAGGENTITVKRATPGATVTFMYSRRGGGGNIPGCTLQQNALQLDSPTVIGTAIADANGVATITRTVPPIARNQTILFQAVVQNECAISQLVVHRFE